MDLLAGTGVEVLAAADGVVQKATRKGKVDGNFGSGSQSAVRNFQRNNKLEVDGKCGKETKAAIIAFQNKHDLEPDGEVGLYTWMEILGIPENSKEGQ